VLNINTAVLIFNTVRLSSKMDLVSDPSRILPESCYMWEKINILSVSQLLSPTSKNV